ncbi:MAG: hypothetical protein K9J16_06520 [Melioribacteraceae bacterium]|nr:hypothetical protein [Melioribacteraceae bacterium]MCF8353114.1 hypothetical protein [Melioribacteraceae bacterium]MCF8392740.1 hypothetical protein [Melioribacteraceae bacterium]MCF8418271.1 hypothetical protein [Melioribacteraceae bacterium]
MRYKIIAVCLLSTFLLTNCDRNDPGIAEDDGLPPLAPANLSVYLSRDGEVGIEWAKNIEYDLKGYNIYRSVNDTSNFEFRKFTASNFYYELYLAYDSTYYYKISAIDKQERESNYSGIVWAKPMNVYPPYPPQGVSINARNWYDTLSIRLNWYASYDADIKHYEIHKSTVAGFFPDSLTLLASTTQFNWIDKDSLQLNTDYSYKIVAVDKGGLKSKPSAEVSDKLLSEPVPVFPENNQSLDFFYEFRFRAVTSAAKYKIIIKTDERFGTVDEIEFETSQINTVVSVYYNTRALEPYRKYYWQILTFTQNIEPNSFSDIYSFTILPEFN